MKISKCRSCGSSSLIKCLNLGNQYLTGIFPKNQNEKVSKGNSSFLKETRGKLIKLGNLRKTKEN